MIDLEALTTTSRVRTLVSIVGILGVVKAGLLVAKLSIIGRLVGGADGTVVVVALLIALFGAGSLAVARGQRTRAAALIVVVTSFALMIQVPGTASHHYYLLTLVFLIVAGWSDEDTRASGGDAHDVPGWPLVLLRCQLSIIYGFTALSKLNSDFVSGTVAYRLAGASIVAVPLPASLSRSVGFWASTSIVLVTIEACLTVVVWVPRWRRVTLAVAVPMHLAMTVFASSDLQTFAEIAVFTATVFVLYAAFAPETPGATASQAGVTEQPNHRASVAISSGWDQPR